MKRCQKCNVPLEGPFGKVANVIFKVSTSDENPDICNKCSVKSPKKYKCQICERYIDEDVALSHAKAEEYIINLLKKDHPEWKDEEKTCHECVEYYRKLVKDSEI